MQVVAQDFAALQAALAGEYSLERELGRGGMGVVYLARDVQLDRHVAIKVLPSHLAESRDAQERFLREARTAARLSHPNIVPIHRVGEAGGLVFFVMMFVDGETLGQRLRSQGPLTSREAMRMLREVAWALAYAHSHGIVHRDVKPDNILLEKDSGRALVSDFGIAHGGTLTVETNAGSIMGTAQFMSPEQATCEPPDGRSDLYSLGVVGFLAVSGRLPFEAPNVPALLLKHVTEPAPRLEDVNPGVSRALALAVACCLEKDPANRFRDGEELADALAPEDEGRPQLSIPLRNWLADRNPAQAVYVAWSAVLAIPFLSELGAYVDWQDVENLSNMGLYLILAAVPVLPLIGFHASRARQLFLAGYTVADLRGALDVGAAELAQGETFTKPEVRTASTYALFAATYACITAALTMTFFLSPFLELTLDTMHRFGFAMNAASPERQFFVHGTHWLFTHRVPVTVTAWIASVVLLIVCNVKSLPVVPGPIRRFFRVGLRERLWRSRLGAWMAKQLGERPGARPVAAGLFRPTEVALGAALAELYAALPASYRDQLAELPAVVRALEARARAARRELETLEGVAIGAGGVTDAQRVRRDVTKSRLATSVAALEAIRLDLWRLHAGGHDLDPLTTLLDVATRLGQDLRRLTVAQQEVAADAALRKQHLAAADDVWLSR